MITPVVSVLVPSYNHSDYLVDRIESIMKQSYKDFELIVIDDKSKDDSNRVLEKLKEKYNFTYVRNKKNSGTPFSSWESICKLARGKYIWVCESDDVADKDFLKIAISRLEGSPKSVIFYSNSRVINEKGEIIGDTKTYFSDFWKSSRWETDFTSCGDHELVHFQLKGQTVPNMSSALFRKNAFIKSFSPHLTNFKLTGDWLFVGQVMKYGDVEFCSSFLNSFRKHNETSRVRVDLARSQAEFILTKYRLFKISGSSNSQFLSIMGSDVVRYIHSSVPLTDILKSAIMISASDTFHFGCLFFIRLVRSPIYIKHFIIRKKYAKSSKFVD